MRTTKHIHLLLSAVLFGLSVSLPAVVSGNSELVDPGIHFLAERNPDALVSRRNVADGKIAQRLFKLGKTEFFSGGRIENFLGNGLNESTYPARQRRGVMFLAAKRRMLSSTVVEFEVGSYLGERDLGVHGAAYAELDLEALKLRAAVTGDAYVPKEGPAAGLPENSKWQFRTIADIALRLRGIRPLPAEAELEIDGHFEHDFGKAFQILALKSPTFAEVSLKFTTPFAGSADIFEENPESRVSVTAFADTLGSLDVATDAVWFLHTTGSWDIFANFTAAYQRNGQRTKTDKVLQISNVILTPSSDPAASSADQGHARTRVGLEGIWSGSSKHAVTIEPGLKWNLTANGTTNVRRGIGGELKLKHDWRLSDKWILSNALEFTYFQGNRKSFTYHPELKFETQDYAASVYLKGVRHSGKNLLDVQPVFDERVIGGAVSFYKVDSPHNTFELAVNGEYIKRSNGGNQTGFGVRLDIGH